MNRTRILLADDHKILVEGLRSLLEPEFELVGMVEDGRALVAAAEKLQPDVIVADISMPLLNGIEAVRQIRANGSSAKVIFLTMHPDVSYARRALEEGASGFVLKHSASSELVTAIRQALIGQIFITPSISDKLRNSWPNPSDPEQRLSSRQREVLELLAEGKSAKETAETLNISRRTVEFHKYRMMEMLGIHNSAELIQYAIRNGMGPI